MSFECAVCYTDGQSGIVTPTCCSHKICLTCYTNIVINNPSNPICPQCRAEYIKKEELIQTPPLAGQASPLVGQASPLAGQASPLATAVEEELENLLYYINSSQTSRIDPFGEAIGLFVENRFIREPTLRAPTLRDPNLLSSLLSGSQLISEPLLFVEPLLMTNTFYVGR